MPGLNGLNLCREIKKELRTKNIPILVIKDKNTDENAFHTLGVKDFIATPFVFKELLEKIELLVVHGATV